MATMALVDPSVVFLSTTKGTAHYVIVCVISTPCITEIMWHRVRCSRCQKKCSDCYRSFTHGIPRRNKPLGVYVKLMPPQIVPPMS
jgi:hypothetical protein